jgi:hypothetical protein
MAYGGGLGGVTDGLLRSGLYKVLVVVEFDPVTADKPVSNPY